MTAFIDETVAEASKKYRLECEQCDEVHRALEAVLEGLLHQSVIIRRVSVNVWNEDVAAIALELPADYGWERSEDYDPKGTNAGPPESLIGIVLAWGIEEDHRAYLDVLSLRTRHSYRVDVEQCAIKVIPDPE